MIPPILFTKFLEAKSVNCRKKFGHPIFVSYLLYSTPKRSAEIFAILPQHCEPSGIAVWINLRSGINNHEVHHLNASQESFDAKGHVNINSPDHEI